MNKILFAITGTALLAVAGFSGCASDRTKIPAAMFRDEVRAVPVRPPLTEAEILAHRARGFSVKEIADHLGISISTVKTHLDRMLKKLKVHSSLELLCWVRDHQCQRCTYRMGRRSLRRPFMHCVVAKSGIRAGLA